MNTITHKVYVIRNHNPNCNIPISAMQNYHSFLNLQLSGVSCFGRLMNPVSRASAWRNGLATPTENDDDLIYDCIKTGNHGNNYLWGEAEGQCGICGDSWRPLPRRLEAPGKFAKGVVTGDYNKGQNITVTVKLVENIGGYFMFRLCPNDNIRKDPDQTCFNRYLFHSRYVCFIRNLEILIAKCYDM